MSYLLAREGCILILWDVDAAGLQRTAEQVRAVGASAYTFVCNVADREAVKRTAHEVRAHTFASKHVPIGRVFTHGI